ncbi:hypothetical protein ACQY0O_001912 [Thecaphora frezii]
MSFLKRAQQQIAHTSTVPVLGNQDLRSLQDVISSEKDFIKSNARAASDFKKNAEALRAWSADEGADLNDVLGKLATVMDNYTASQNRYNAHLSTVRLHFKSIRTREEALADLKHRKRSLGSNIEKVERKLSKMGPENKELMKVTTQLREMRNEMEALRIEVMEEEAAIGDFKRRTAKEALGIKCGGLLEMAEKLIVVAEIGKLMLGEIPLTPTQPAMPRAEYYGFARTEQLLQEAARSIADVGFNPVGPSPGVRRFGHDGEGGDLSSLASPAIHHDDGYSPYGAAHSDAGRNHSSVAPTLSINDVAGTPIYASHASTSRWNADVQSSTFNSNGLNDPAADEWGRPTSAQHGEAGGVRGDDNALESYRDQPAGELGGSLAMQHSASAQGSAPTRGSSPPHSADHQHSNEWVQPHATERKASGEVPVPNQAYDTDQGYSDPNAGPTAASEKSAAGHVDADTEADARADAPATAAAAAAPSSGAAYHNLGAPMLPPLRTSTPLPSTALEAEAPTASSPAPASYEPTSYVASPTTAVPDDLSYFQSVGATRAHQEAMRRPTSLGENPIGPGSRSSTYGSLSPGLGGGPSDGGKKVTAAAFRRGFNRAPSNQAIAPAAASADSGGASTPVPPGGYASYTPTPAVTTPEGDLLASATPPLHIQKRHSAIGAAAAGSPASFSGRRYSIEDVSGSDAPAPPYGYPGDVTNGHGLTGTGEGAGGGSSGYEASGGSPARISSPPATYQYSEPHKTAPAPPVYGYQ